MTFKEFLYFITQDGNHFFGFLIVFFGLGAFLINLVNAIKKQSQ